MDLPAAPTSAHLSITPAIEAGDGAFLAGFSRHAIGSHSHLAPPPDGRVARIWPGQPAVPSPWVPCAEGCCLVLASTRARVDVAGQWLRFLIAEFLGDQHQLDGCVAVPSVSGRQPALLIVEAGQVFEGELAEEPAPEGYRPTVIEPDSSDPNEVHVSPRPNRGPGRGTAASCLLLLAAVTGCGGSAGDEEPTRAADSSASASDSSSSTSVPSSGTMPVGDAVEVGQALIVSTSNVDGSTSPEATALVDDRAVDAFLADTDARLADDVRAAVETAEVPEGSTLYAAVVAVGCDLPVALNWEKTADGVEATALLPKSGVQCLVPITSVALFLVAGSG